MEKSKFKIPNLLLISLSLSLLILSVAFAYYLVKRTVPVTAETVNNEIVSEKKIGDILNLENDTQIILTEAEITDGTTYGDEKPYRLLTIEYECKSNNCHNPALKAKILDDQSVIIGEKEAMLYGETGGYNFTISPSSSRDLWIEWSNGEKAKLSPYRYKDCKYLSVMQCMDL